jgi:23S rRNA pseudouridine1911/1915/1917 synthase
MRNMDQIIESDAFPDEGESESEGESRPWRIPPRLHGERLDKALAELIAEFSRSYLQQLIEAGAVTMSGKALTKPSHKVKAGDEGAIELRPTPQSQAFKPEAIELDVLHEDEHLLVLDKPAGLVVHPAPGNWSGTLMNGLLARNAKAFGLPRAGIVHRLDKDTSGLMVVARTQVAMMALAKMIAAREVSRQYLALAHRAWNGNTPRVVDGAIGRDPNHRLRMAVVDLRLHSGKTAQTDFHLLHNADEACLLRCVLHTGRTHQIRVHAASIGHPLVGDAMYGGEAKYGLERQGLHAWRLAFAHPVTGKDLVFHADPPQDFSKALNALGLNYNALQDVLSKNAPL